MKKKSPKKKKQEELEKVIRVYIRMRDKNICQWCSKKVSGADAHCSHVIPKSHGNVLRFDEYNLKLLCFHCHINRFHKNPMEAAEWFKSKFPERWDYLQENKEKIVKFGIEDYQDMIDDYNDKLAGFDIRGI